MSISNLGIISAIVISAAACAQTADSGEPSLTGAWRVIEIDGAAVPADAPVNANFGADGRVSGQSGCNQYGGAYAYKKGVVTLDQMMMTEMACIDEGRMDLEAKFHNRFSGALAVGVSADGALTLSDDDGRIVLRKAGGA